MRSAYWLIVAAVMCCSTAFRSYDPGFVVRLRVLGFDTWQQLFPRKIDPAYPVRLIDIDERSFREIEHWPWRRDLLARLVDKLVGLGAVVVAFDMVFPDPGRAPLDGVPDTVRGTPEFGAVASALAAYGTPDEQFARAIADRPVVLGVIGNDQLAGRLPAQRAGIAVAGAPPGSLPGYAGATVNLPMLEARTAGLGSLNWFPEQDQIMRRVPTVVRIGDKLYPSLVAEALRLATGAGSIAIRTTSSARPAVSAVRIGGAIIPTDGDGQVWLSFSRHDPKRSISAADVLQDRVTKEQIEGRIIVVGTSAPGLLDLRATPLDRVIAGAEINAQAIEQLIDATYLLRPDFAKGAELLAAILISLVLAVIIFKSGAIAAASVGALSVAGMVGGVAATYSVWSLLLDAVYPILTATATYIVGTGFLYYRTEMERNRNRTALAIIAKEMEAAAQIQRSFLPKDAELPGQSILFDLYATMKPAKHIGGDFFDYFLLDERRLAVAIGDVSGKGVPAALFMSVSRTVLRTVAFEGGKAGDVLTRVNDILARDNEEGMFVTLFYAVLDLETGVAEYSSAGHDDVHAVGADGSHQSIRYLGPAIGLMEDIPFPTRTQTLAPGDTLLLLTDGIAEAFDAGGLMYGSERVAAFLKGNPHCGARQTVERMTAEIDTFAKGAEQSDDITCLAVQWLGPQSRT